MIIFKGFLPRNSAQNLLLRGSLTQENSAQKVLVLRSSCRVPLSRVCAMLGRPWFGDVRRPHHRRATWSAPPSPSRATKWLVKPLTGGAKKHIIGVSSEITTCDILCGVGGGPSEVAGGGRRAHTKRNLGRGGCETLPQGKGGISWTESRWRQFCANLA